MRKPRFDPVTAKYEIGDLVVWVDVIDGSHDEVGIIKQVVVGEYGDDSLPLYIILLPYGEDIVTGWDAQFVLVPHDVYIEKKEKIRKRLDSDDERVTLSIRSSH
tara:strand:- start:188 stop:499 length:312 start_codon:yes stop_codon:yes gene_type:complete